MLFPMFSRSVRSGFPRRFRHSCRGWSASETPLLLHVPFARAVPRSVAPTATPATRVWLHDALGVKERPLSAGWLPPTPLPVPADSARGGVRQSAQSAVLQDSRELGRVAERAWARHPERPVRERWDQSAAPAVRRTSRGVERLVRAIAPSIRSRACPRRTSKRSRLTDASARECRS